MEHVFFSQRVCQRTYPFGRMLAGYTLPSNQTRVQMDVATGLLLNAHHSFAAITHTRMHVGTQMPIPFFGVNMQWPLALIAFHFVDCMQNGRHHDSPVPPTVAAARDPDGVLDR